MRNNKNKKQIDSARPGEYASRRFDRAYSKKYGCMVATGKASEWGGSRAHAQTFGPLAHNKRIAFAIFKDGFWHEPNTSYASWAEAYRQNIDFGGGF